MEWLSDTFGEFRPDVSPDQILGLSTEQACCLLIDVGIPPVRVQRDDGVADTLERVAKRLIMAARRLATVAPGIGLRHEYASPKQKLIGDRFYPRNANSTAELPQGHS